MATTIEKDKVLNGIHLLQILRFARQFNTPNLFSKKTRLSRSWVEDEAGTSAT